MPGPPLGIAESEEQVEALQSGIRVGRRSPFQGCAQVRQLGGEAMQDGIVSPSAQHRRFGALGQPDVVGEMALAHGIDLISFDQPRGGILADGLEQPVPHFGVLFASGDQRLVDQAGQQIEHGIAVDSVAATHVLGGLQRPAASERCEPPQQRPLTLAEQLVAPVDGGLQGLLAWHRRAAAAGEQVEPIAQALGDLPGREYPHPRGGQLDGERDAVELLTDLRDGGRVDLSDPEIGTHLHGAVDEQARRVGPSQDLDRRTLDIDRQ
ncbi:MAG: hypothetical protein ACRDST_16125 [Pseudonocardiaceae bacterium]